MKMPQPNQARSLARRCPAGALGLALVLAWFLGQPTVQAQSTAPDAPSTPATTRPSGRSMFRPVQGSPAAHSRPAVPPAWRTFQLVGMVQGEKAQALVLFVESGESLWVQLGERLAGMEIMAVEPDALVLRVGEAPVRLQVGQSSLALGASRVFSGHGRVMGVFMAPERAYALFAFGDHRDPVPLTLGDQIPGGRITSIEPQGVWVSHEGASRLVKVGQTTQVLTEAPGSEGAGP